MNCLRGEEDVNDTALRWERMRQVLAWARMWKQVESVRASAADNGSEMVQDTSEGERSMLAVRVIAFVFLGITTVASARVTSITIAAVEPFAPGTTFGSAGEYQRVRGTFK